MKSIACQRSPLEPVTEQYQIPNKRHNTMRAVNLGHRGISHWSLHWPDSAWELWQFSRLYVIFSAFVADILINLFDASHSVAWINCRTLRYKGKFTTKYHHTVMTNAWLPYPLFKTNRKPAFLNLTSYDVLIDSPIGIEKSAIIRCRGKTLPR